MTEQTPTGDWRCRVGRHHHVAKRDVDPKAHGTLLQCDRCGHRKVPPTFNPETGIAHRFGGGSS